MSLEEIHETEKSVEWSVPVKPLLSRNVVAESPLEIKQVYKLLQCVNQKNKERVEKMVRLGVPGLINLTEPKEGTSALHLVSVANDLDMARLLLSLKAHPDIQDKRGRTAMMLAAELGQVRMVELLANNKASMTLVDKEGKGLLFYCIGPTKMHAQILEMAVNMDADVKNISYAGKSVFMFACEKAKECENLCVRLLERGADPNAADPVTGCTALMAAVRAGSVALVRAILNTGGNPNTVDRMRLHAAHIAAAKGFFEVLRMLSGYSADFNLTSLLGNTAMHAAAAGGHAECCRFLFQRGCSVMKKNQQELLPSQIAKKNGHKAALKELKEAEQAMNSGKLPSVTEARLHDWSYEHEAELRQAFQPAEEADAPVDSVSKETFVSVLQAHHAPIDDDSLKTVISLLDRNCWGKVNINDFFMGSKFLPNKYELSSYKPTTLTTGRTDKMEAKTDGCPQTGDVVPDMMKKIDGILQYLSKRFEPFTDTSRQAADRTEDPSLYFDEPKEIYINASLCVRRNDFESLSLAFSQHVPVDIRDHFYKTPLMTACIIGNYQMARFLISHGANVNMYDQFQWTALHHACFAGHADIVKLLLEHSAVVDATTSNGVTPLMRAIQSCKFNCVDQLVNSGANIEAINKHGQNCLVLAQMYGTREICDFVEIELERTKLSQAKGSGKEKILTPAPPAAKEGVTEKTKKSAGQRRRIIALNPHTTDHCITLPSTTFWGKEVVSTPQLEQRQADRKNHFTNEDKMKISEDKPISANTARNPRQKGATSNR
ncbi:ankyrin repeat and EF-hand domain-containing protein 1-like [Pangasianodon hypophthalmus]|uniref:ankyrin repeat and EF-hand domain-containing protein 1-like n=1 Tax=Pangasianodon hypophthalmus TaxID=310915 RepID=UPI0023081267|nr:ankyrin repeat and EF-hand domain-containing protein 1-like [Pangasianodon hypophthalmus]